MVPTEREIFIDVEPDVRIRYRRGEPPPPVSYAITLETFETGSGRQWASGTTPIAVDEHHEHAYTRAGGKQAPAVLGFSSSNEAMAAAIRKTKTEAPEIVRQWRAS